MKRMTIRRQLTESLTPMTIPVSYIGAYDILNDPQKLVGFIVLILQGVYIMVKIYKETRRDKENEK